MGIAKICLFPDDFPIPKWHELLLLRDAKYFSKVKK